MAFVGADSPPALSMHPDGANKQHHVFPLPQLQQPTLPGMLHSLNAFLQVVVDIETR